MQFLIQTKKLLCNVKKKCLRFIKNNNFPELVNLLLIGEAVSNVFDNTVHFSEEMILKVNNSFENVHC